MDKERIRSRLLTQKEGLLDRVGKTHKHLYEREQAVSPVFSEQSVEMESQQLIYVLDAEGREKIRKIDKALERLDEGTYGFCMECGDSINKERLIAIPFADLCIDCANEEQKI